MFDATSPLWGNLILIAAIVCAAVGMAVRRDRLHASAMAGYREQMARYEEAVAAAARSAAAPPAVSAVSVGEVVLTGVDEKTAAMLIAIVCDTLGGDPAGLQFKAVKAL